MPLAISVHIDFVTGHTNNAFGATVSFNTIGALGDNDISKEIIYLKDNHIPYEEKFNYLIEFVMKLSERIEKLENEKQQKIKETLPIIPSKTNPCCLEEIKIYKNEMNLISEQVYKNILRLEDHETRQKLIENEIGNIICENKIAKTQWNLTMKQIKQLEKWTSLKCCDILFNSNVDDWSKHASVFNKQIIGKKQLTFIIEDENGEIFGYYYNTEIVENYCDKQETDSISFQFNLQSRNNRLKQPMKFEIKDTKYAGIRLQKTSIDFLIMIGDIVLYKKNTKNLSFSGQINIRFNYHGIKNALCGKVGSYRNGKTFTPKRILVIQME